MQTQNLQIVPKGVKPIIRASQSDVGRTFQLHLYDGATEYTPPTGTTLRLDGIKPDKTAFSYTDNLTLSGSVITVTCKTQMTLIPGTVQCEIRMTKGSEDIGTINFDLMVEKSPINGTTDLSQTEVPALVTLARVEMEDAEAWAIGTKGGVPVGPSDPQYQNNAKYWSEQISGDGQEAEAWAVGTKSGVPVPSTDPQYHNNAKYYAQEAGSSATTAGTAATNASSSAQSASTSASAAGTSASNAAAAASKAEAAVVHGPYIGANGNWYVYDFTTQQYTDTNVKAQGPQGPQGIQGLPGEDGTNGTDGVGIVSITKTATQGLVDTYTVLLTNGQTYTFTVTNGQNGTGSGDMLAANYDPTQAVYNAGGIVAYVAAQLAGFSTSLSGLDDVTLSSLATGQSLFYDATAQKWVNRKIDYSDIQNTPTLGTAAAKNSTNAVTPNSTALVESGAVSAEIQTLTNEVDTIVNDLSAKNIFNIEKWLTTAGLTYTKNGDTYTTSTGGTSYSSPFSFADADIDIVISGILTNITSSYARIEVLNSSDNVVATINEGTTSASGKGCKIRLNYSTAGNFSIEKPMIRDASIKNADYAPYAMTNRELTEELNGNYILAECNILVSEYSDGTKTIKNLLDALYTDISNIISGLANDEIICVQYIDGTFGKQCPTSRRYYAKGDTFSESYFSIYTTSGPLIRTFHVQLSTTTNASKSELNGASPTLTVTSLNSDIVPNNSRLYFAYEKYKKIG